MNYRKLTGTVFIFLTTILWSANVSGQSINNTTFGKGIRVIAADTSFSLKFSARFQTLYQGVTSPITDDWEDRFLIRRARLKFEGFVLTPKLEYKIELGLSNNDIGSDLLPQHDFASNIILDAVAKWEFAPRWELWFGQTKLPGNRERIISSQKLQFVDRSLLNSRYNIDRDAGVQLHHVDQIGQVIIREIGSISTGEGRNIAVNNTGGYDYAAKLEIFPFGEFEGDGSYVGSDIYREETPKLAIAASYNHNDGAVRAGGQLGDFLSEERDLNTIFLDAMFKYRGFSAMVEYANKQAPEGPVVVRSDLGIVEETFVTGEGFNVQAGYLFKTDWEVAGRYTTYAPAEVTNLREQQQYTLGVSKYIVGHSLKVQSDVSLIEEEGRENVYQYRLQLEIAL